MSKGAALDPALSYRLKLAVAVVLISRRTVQTVPSGLVEVHPLQPVKEDVPVAEAVSTTVLPVVNCALQDDGVAQLMPPVTVPVPVPAKSTVRIGWGPAGVQPSAAGPSTVMVAGLLDTRLGLS